MKGKKKTQGNFSAFGILCKEVLDVFVDVKLWQGGSKVSDTDLSFWYLLAGGLSGCQLSSTRRVVTCFKHFPFRFLCSIKSRCVAVSLSGRPWQTEQHPKQCSPVCTQPPCVCGCSSCISAPRLPREPRLPPPSPGEVNNSLVLSV